MDAKELTSEDKIKVFGLYINSGVHFRDYTYCKTEADFEKENSKPLTYLNLLTPTTLTTSYAGSITVRDISRIVLILKPLSEISDEDAIEVAKMLKVDYSNKEDADAHFDLPGIAVWLVEIFITETEYRYFSGYRYVVCIDFLRSRGYALPYKGIDLFEAGIAITTNQPQ